MTPPPVDEYQLEKAELTGAAQLSRTAANTKIYADSCRQVGESMGIVVLDVWSAFALEAGWQPGQGLPGSLSMPKSKALEELLTDGMLLTRPFLR